jgi:hypothetical protein
LAMLDKARAEVDGQKEKAKESTDLLWKEQENREATQTWVTVTEEELTKCVTEHDALKAAKDTDAAEIKKFGRDVQQAMFQVTSVKKELGQALEIASGKPYLLQSIFGR